MINKKRDYIADLKGCFKTLLIGFARRCLLWQLLALWDDFKLVTENR